MVLGFDIFDIYATREQLDRIHTVHAVNHIQLLLVLRDKGLITDADLCAAKSRAIHLVEQEWARVREEALTKGANDDNRDNESEATE